MSWRDFWDGDTPIYVNERHRRLHYRLIARGILDAMAELAPPGAAAALPVVLDHGCGEALSAGDVAAHCARLYLCEAAASVRAKLSRQFGGIANIAVINPVEVADIETGSLDLVVANSLVQYLSRSEFASALSLWRRALKPTGHLMLADILPRQLSPAADARALLAFGAKGGFMFAALGGLARTALSDYRKLRTELGLATYDEAEMLQILKEAGFTARRRRPNLGHNQARMAFIAAPLRLGAGAEPAP